MSRSLNRLLLTGIAGLWPRSSQSLSAVPR
jgi:hypothetical protein